LPTEKAHGLSTVKICEAFSKCGYKVDLIIPKLWRHKSENIYDYYGVKKRFRILKIPCIDLIPVGVLEKFTFLLQSLSFSFFLTIFVLIKYGIRNKKVIFFSHDYIPLYPMTFLSNYVFYDIHHFPGQNLMYKRIMNKSFGFAVQTKWKIKELENKFHIPPNKIVYWPNGTEIERFNISQSKTEARKILGLPLDAKIIMYTGQLFDWKGVDSLIKSISFLPNEMLIYIVGGSDQDILNCKKEIAEANNNRIIFVKFVPNLQIPLWLRVADVLVLPNTGKKRVSLYYTSPMKLFEYMAAKKPIISSAIPSIMEILNDKNSILVEPDNPEAIGLSVKKIFSDPILSENISTNSFLDVQKFTWTNRAEKIIDYFSTYE